MIKNRSVLFYFLPLVIEIHGMDDPSRDKNLEYGGGEKKQEKNISDHFIPSSLNNLPVIPINSSTENLCIQLQPVVHLPADVVHYMCHFMLGDWRDISSIFRTNRYYHRIGKIVITNIKSQLQNLDLESISGLPNSLFVLKMIDNPIGYQKLATLNLRGCGIGDVKRFPCYFRNCKTPVDLRTRIISGLLKLTNLTHLNLSNNKLYCDFMCENNHMGQLIRTLPLQYLDLSYNDLGASIELLAAENPQQLTYLDLSYNNLNLRDSDKWSLRYPQFQQFISHNKSLIHLRMAGIIRDLIPNKKYSMFEKYDYSDFFRDLMNKENQIRYLDIGHNDLQFWRPIFRTLSQNTHLEILNLSFSKLNIAGINELLSVLGNGRYRILCTLLKSFKATLQIRRELRDDKNEDLKKKAYQKLFGISERLRVSGNISFAEELLVAWDSHFNEDQMKEITDILGTMNISLIHLDLFGTLLGDAIQDSGKIMQKFKVIPGLWVDSEES